MRYSTCYLWLKYLNRESSVGLMCIAAPLGLLTTAPVIWILIDQWRFITDGAVVDGQVIMKREATRWVDQPFLASTLLAHGGGNRKKYFVQYEFLDAAGVRHTNETSVSFNTWRDAVRGNTIAIRYVRSDPAQNQLEGNYFTFWPVLMFGSVGMIIVFITVRNGLRRIAWVTHQVRLIRDGEAVRGSVIHANIEGNRSVKYTLLDYICQTTPPINGSTRISGKLRRD